MLCSFIISFITKRNPECATFLCCSDWRSSLPLIFFCVIYGSGILAINNVGVVFRYKKNGNKKRKAKWRTMSLNAGEFIRRFLQHFLPKGFHKVRFYGLLSPANRHRLVIGQNMLSDDSPFEPVAEVGDKDESTPDCTNMTCRFCGKGIMIIIKTLPAIKTPNLSRGPP